MVCMDKKQFTILVNCAALERYKWIINRVRSFGMKVTLTFFHHPLPPWAAEYDCWKMEKTADYFMDFTSCRRKEKTPILQKHVSHLVYENGHMRTQLQSAFSCVILLAIAEETLAEFLSKASRTAVDWVQMIEMKTFAPTTFAAARDFWTLRYSTNYEC
ncbi:hypothetical protein Q3G72_019160 [Acer saccharum]|nr:hypothetical protein Q3G72_019160 [Acer saccharum]